MKSKILTLTIAAALSATWAMAQEGPPRPPGAPRDGERKSGPRDGDGQKGAGPREGQRQPGGGMPMALLRVLDADEDGIISAEEIKGAPAALKKLDKNADGQLSREELQPPPQRPPGDGQRGEGARGEGPRDGERPRGEGPRDGERPRGGPRDGDGKPPGANRDQANGGDRGAGERGAGERPPAPPLLGALDADHDGALSAEEIARSGESLAKLDQNKDGQLGPREFGGRPPQGPPREGAPGGAKPPQ